VDVIGWCNFLGRFPYRLGESLIFTSFVVLGMAAASPRGSFVGRLITTIAIVTFSKRWDSEDDSARELKWDKKA
jgi:hypothetical protein